jgi:hypothetical protein
VKRCGREINVGGGGGGGGGGGESNVDVNSVTLVLHIRKNVG